MKIQYISDIHLELYTNKSNLLFKNILKPIAPYLALCGDIGYPGAPLYESFLEYCSNNFKQVFYVAGNHEFYNDTKSIKFLKNKLFISKELDEDSLRRLSTQFSRETPEIRNKKIQEVCSKFKNIHFLDKDIIKISGKNIIIVGCTLWSKLDMNPFILSKFNDFHRICEDKDKLLEPTTYNNWNKNHIEFLNTTLRNLQDENPEIKIVVLTHHCPTYDLIIDKYLSSDSMNSFFANKGLENLFGKNVKAWICGHTHGCKTVIVNGTILTTNTLGYIGEKVDGFKVDAIIEI